MARFWKTIVTVEVLTKGELPPAYRRLEDVAYDIIEGDASGHTEYGPTVEVSRDEMAALLKAQGSDPEFFTWG